MRTYSENFKKQVVKKVLADGIKQSEVSRKLNIGESTILKWKKKYADEVRHEVEKINIDQFFIEEEVDIDKLLLASEPEPVRNEKEIVDNIVSKGKIPSEYTTSEKCVILSYIRKMPKDQTGFVLRTFGLTGQHIKLWEDEILSMGKKQINRDEYIKELEAENKELKKKLKNTEKEKYELEVLIELKKKYKTLFKEDGEE